MSKSFHRSVEKLLFSSFITSNLFILFQISDQMIKCTILSNRLFLHTFFFVIFVLLLVYAYFKFVAYSYWKKLGVPHDEPIVPLGSINTKAFLKKITLGEFQLFIAMRRNCSEIV